MFSFFVDFFQPFSPLLAVSCTVFGKIIIFSTGQQRERERESGRKRIYGRFEIIKQPWRNLFATLNPVQAVIFRRSTWHLSLLLDSRLGCEGLVLYLCTNITVNGNLDCFCYFNHATGES